MFNYSEEFDNQLKTLILKGYPKLLQQTEEQFTDSIVPLKAKLKSLYFNNIDYEKGYLPFVIVVQVKNIDQNLLVSLTEKNGKKGISKLFPLNEQDFQVTDLSICEEWKGMGNMCRAELDNYKR